MKSKKITYAQAGVNYGTLDPVKIMAQSAARKTAKNLDFHGFSEVSETRGESAYVWKQGDVYMASVIEGMGTKNLVADAMRRVTGKTYYDVIGHDTIAASVNDLISVGAVPLVINAYWAVGDSKFLSDLDRTKDLIRGWKSACDLAGVSWGGGETPTYKGIINPQTIDLGSSVVGIIKDKKSLITDKKLQSGDAILLLKSTGINVNGLSLARAIAAKIPKHYETKLPCGKMYGELLLTKTSIYARLIQDLLKANINLHYLSNITGHGLRKIMRSRFNFTYVLEKIFTPQELFLFMQRQSGLSNYEMYQTFNMGQDYTIFLPEKDVSQAQKIIKKNGFESLLAGHVEDGEKQVLIKQKNIVYKSSSLDLRL